MDILISQKNIKAENVAYFNKFKKDAANVYIKPKTKTQKAKLSALLKTRNFYQAIIITEDISDDVVDSDVIKLASAKVFNDFMIGSYITYDDLNSVSYEKAGTVTFKDQKTRVYIESYANAKFIIPYFITTTILSIMIFLFPVLAFIARKMHYLNKINSDIEVIATGDLNHEIVLKGNDEITHLASEIDFLRKSLVANIEKEHEARHKNRDLITNLSHDIRSPLTALKGYLEILSLHKYQNEQQMQQYLEICNNKIDDISELSNKMFEYLMVYDENKIYELQPLSSDIIFNIIHEHIEFLELKGFEVYWDVQNGDCSLLLNEQLIRRIFSNLFSNLMKYADHQHCITITVDKTKQKLAISIYNAKTKEPVKESNNIGLKSVSKMVELMHGDLYVHDTETGFITVINFPIIQNK